MNVVIDRGFASRALDGVALMARTAARLKRYLYHRLVDSLLSDTRNYVHGDFQLRKLQCDVQSGY